jgi:phosphoribosylglycinamide formyltransferase 1
VKIHGCTVHFVVPEMDAGPIVLQEWVPVKDEDTPDTLGARVLEQEHRTYPAALAMVAGGKVLVKGNRVLAKR